jgi:hypothetical protein
MGSHLIVIDYHNTKTSNTMKLLFFALIITLASVVMAQSSEAETTMPETPQPVVSMGKLSVTVDNYIFAIYINGVQLSNVISSQDWSAGIQSFSLPFVPGDVIAIQGVNNGAVGINNPAAILAQVVYQNSANQTVTLLTNSAWFCSQTTGVDINDNFDGFTRAREYNANGDFYNIWQANKGGPMYGISLDSKWIWSTNEYAREIVCKIVLPDVEPHIDVPLATTKASTQVKQRKTIK